MLDKCRSLAYDAEMEFEWDDTKSNVCFERRGFDFAYVVRAFRREVIDYEHNARQD